MLIDFCSLYINREQIPLNPKSNKFTKYQVSHLPDLNNSKESNKKKQLSNKSKLKITFKRQTAVANNYLNSTLRRRSNNLSKLHEFENNLLVKKNEQNAIAMRREKNINNNRDKQVRKMAESGFDKIFESLEKF